MPYIKQEDRKKWKKTIDEVVRILDKIPENKVDGEINYLFSSILHKHYVPCYYEYNRMIGVLECIKQEAYRKIVAPYEDKKIKENGDVE